MSSGSSKIVIYKLLTHTQTHTQQGLAFYIIQVLICNEIHERTSQLANQPTKQLMSYNTLRIFSEYMLMKIEDF